MINTTNGEMIKELFPNCKIVVMSYPINKIGFKAGDGNPDDDYAWFSSSWWNANYKTEVRKICGNELSI